MVSQSTAMSYSVYTLHKIKLCLCIKCKVWLDTPKLLFYNMINQPIKWFEWDVNGIFLIWVARTRRRALKRSCVCFKCITFIISWHFYGLLHIINSIPCYECVSVRLIRLYVRLNKNTTYCEEKPVAACGQSSPYVWGASTTAVTDTCTAPVVYGPLVLNSKDAV